MSATMTRERIAAFGAALNAHDSDLVMSFFSNDCVYHASFGPELLGTSHAGRAAIRNAVQASFDRFPDGCFEDFDIMVAGDTGTFEWTFVTTDEAGNAVRARGVDLFEFAGDRIRIKNTFRKQRT